MPGFDRGLTSFWIIMPIALAVRRLPYTVRAAHSSLLLVHRSMGEAAQSVGATGLRPIRDISLPLIWKGIVVGSSSEGAALGAILIAVAAFSVLLINRLAAWRMGGVFG